jgi:hypothetical protein
MYLDRVPAYTYDLPCGPDHRFRSFTPSQPHSDGRHWFYCRRCPEFVAIRARDLAEYRPQAPGERKRSFGEGELARQMDKAIQRDRVLPVLRRTWGAVTVATLAEQYGVPERLVRGVAEDLGIYRSALRD